MEQPFPTHPERSWVIQQYLTGALPDDLHQQVEQRRRSDPAFDQAVQTQGLLALYADYERNTIEFYEQTEQLAFESGKTRSVYRTTRPIIYLPQLIKIALAASLVCAFIWTCWYAFVSPAGGVAASVDLESDRSTGFGQKKIVLVRYDHLPGLGGLFQTDSLYRWPGDTLYLYGKELQKLPLDSLQISTTDSTDRYQLWLGQRPFLLQKGHPENRPLEPDETP